MFFLQKPFPLTKLTHLDLVGPVVVCVKADLELGVVVLQPDDLRNPV